MIKGRFASKTGDKRMTAYKKAVGSLLFWGALGKIIHGLPAYSSVFPILNRHKSIKLNS